MSATAKNKRHYSGYRLTDPARVLAQLTAIGVPGLFERRVLEHVTYAYPDAQTAPAARRVLLIGHAAADGVQALLAEVDGTIRRPDGDLFHVTYTLAPGHSPVESKAMLQGARKAGTLNRFSPIAIAVARF